MLNRLEGLGRFAASYGACGPNPPPPASCQLQLCNNNSRSSKNQNKRQKNVGKVISDECAQPEQRYLAGILREFGTHPSLYGTFFKIWIGHNGLQLMQHQHRTRHGSDRKYKCSDCAYSCDNARTLKNHRRICLKDRAAPAVNNDTPERTASGGGRRRVGSTASDRPAQAAAAAYAGDEEAPNEEEVADSEEEQQLLDMTTVEAAQSEDERRVRTASGGGRRRCDDSGAAADRSAAQAEAAACALKHRSSVDMRRESLAEILDLGTSGTPARIGASLFPGKREERWVDPLPEKLQFQQQKNKIAELKCKYSRANAKVRWYKGRKELFSDGLKYKILIDKQSVTLIINNPDPDDSGKYKCEANGVPTNSFVTVEEPPIKYVFLTPLPNTMDIYRTKQGVLACKLNSARAPLVWQRDDEKPIDVDDPRYQIEKDAAGCFTLTIRVVEQIDQGMWTATVNKDVISKCQVYVVEDPRDTLVVPEQLRNETAANEALRRANAEHELRPNDEHETESSDVDEDEYVVESDDDIPAVEFNAVVERNPAPTFVWKKSGQKVPLTGLVRCQTDVDTGKDNAHAAPTATTSSSATTSTTGIYVASATERRSDANSFRVKTAATSNSQSTASAARTAIVSAVSDKVPAWLNHDDMLNLVVRAGQTAEWKVKFGGKPAPKVAWSKNQQPINPKTSEPIQVHTKTNDHTTLRIPATTRADCGAFTLLVRNSKGMDTKTAHLTVLGKPSKPRVPLEVNDVTEYGCVLRWTAPEDDGGLPIDHYEVEKLEGGKWVPCAKVLDCVAQVKELKKGQQYQFRVKAVNKEGKSEELCTEHEIVTKNQYADPGKNPNATDSVTVTIAVKSRHRPTTPKGPRPLAPGKVEKPSVTDWDKDQVHLEWQPPANDGGAELKEYVVEKKDATTGKWVEAIRVAADQTKANVPGLREGEQYQVATYQKTKAIVKGLEEGKEYQFRVKAVNKSGPGLPSEPCEKVVTERIDLDALLKFCHQDDVVLTWKSFEELSSFGTWSKIGEGAFGEVFKGLLENAFTAFKVIPFAENEQQCRKEVNGDHLKPAKFIFNELFITNELTKLSEDTGNGFVTPSFTQLRITKVVKGHFPRKLLSAWDAYKKANPELVENDRPSKYADKGQHFLIIGLSYGGKSLESYEIQSGPECYAIFQQIALSLAIAEDVLEFEHRDLHAGNILVEQCPANEKIRYLYRGEQIDVVSNGVRASIIDFSISRMTKSGAFVFVDLCQNPGLFEQNGVSKGCDYQYDVYKLMKAVVNEKWAKFWPQTNVLWMGYVAKKLSFQTLKTILQRFTIFWFILIFCLCLLNLLPENDGNTAHSAETQSAPAMGGGVRAVFNRTRPNQLLRVGSNGSRNNTTRGNGVASEAMEFGFGCCGRGRLQFGHHHFCAEFHVREMFAHCSCLCCAALTPSATKTPSLFEGQRTAWPCQCRGFGTKFLGGAYFVSATQLMQQLQQQAGQCSPRRCTVQNNERSRVQKKIWLPTLVHRLFTNNCYTAHKCVRSVL
ncbi:hypothetical protein niasHT_039747 [Heterodera trifolii]|uniref:non-specific serine/threonine protein kinase n=1 Tax=Heterodera trifolii TaxID=157864 RepID=A0ABD2HZ08_9BILA